MLRTLLFALAVASPTLAFGAKPAAGDACPAIERQGGPPVHVILYGYPHGAPRTSKIRVGYDLPTLEMIDEDLLLMARFFEALGPTRMHVHGEPAAKLVDRFSVFGVRPPTWRSLLQSVGDVARAIDSDTGGERPVVYLYLAGHGALTPGPHGEGGGRLAIFARPEDGATTLGHDGGIHSAMLAEHVIAPLAARARVHLIADTCFSYHLLQTRGMTRIKRVVRLPPQIVYDDTFAVTFPGAGAHLAARGVTYEDRRNAGRFSHALRSMAAGPADLDGDGVLTYGEMEHALGRVADADSDFPRPQVVPPSLDPDAPFINWWATPAARVCLPAEMSGRRLVADGEHLFATFATPDRPMALWLKRAHTFAIDRGGWFMSWRRFIATDGPIDLEDDISTPVQRSDDPYPDHGAEALTLDEYDPARPPFVPGYPWSLGAAIVAGGSLSNGVALSARSPADAHADLALRVGWRAHRLLIEGGWAWWSFAGPTVTGRPTGITGHRVGGRIGYGWLFSESDAIESDVALLYGRYRLWNAFEGPAQLDVSEPSLRVTALYPFAPGSTWAWRIEGQVGAAYAGRWMGPTIRVGLGVDFEALLY